VVALHPDFAVDPMRLAEVWEAAGCVPLVVAGAELQAARAWVDAWAEGVGTRAAAAV
jgi:hypothetical protein